MCNMNLQLTLTTSLKAISVTHTHTAVLWPFVRDYLGGPVTEEIFTHSHLKRVVGVVIILDFMRHGEDNRGKYTENPSGPLVPPSP